MSKKKLTIEQIVETGMITDASVIRMITKDPSLINSQIVRDAICLQYDTEDEFEIVEEADIEEKLIEEDVIVKEPVVEEPIVEEPQDEQPDEEINEEEMKDLYDVVQEEAATPANTMGMGNPGVDAEGNPTEPVAKAKKCTKKTTKKKSSEEEE